MAVTQYLVLYKFMHPNAKKPITNTSIAKYALEKDGGEGDTRKYAKAYPDTGIDTDEILRQKSTENEKYDMLFMYDGVEEAASLPEVTASGVADQKILMMEKFARCNGEAWFVASKHPALAAALNAAKPLVKSIGKDNVKVVKNVPLDISVGIE